MKYVIFVGFLASAGIFSIADNSDTAMNKNMPDSIQKTQEVPVEFINFTTPLVISVNN